MAYAGRCRRSEARFAALAGAGGDGAAAVGRVLELLRGVVGRGAAGARGPAVPA